MVKFSGVAILAATMVVGLHTEAKGEIFDLKFMINVCRTYLTREVPQEQQFDVGLCVGMITGAVDVGQIESRICMPGGLANHKAVELVLAYIDKFPEDLTKNVSLGILANEAFG